MDIDYALGGMTKNLYNCVFKDGLYHGISHYLFFIFMTGTFIFMTVKFILVYL